MNCSLPGSTLENSHSTHSVDLMLIINLLRPDERASSIWKAQISSSCLLSIRCPWNDSCSLVGISSAECGHQCSLCETLVCISGNFQAKICTGAGIWPWLFKHNTAQDFWDPLFHRAWEKSSAVLGIQKALYQRSMGVSSSLKESSFVDELTSVPQ